MSISLLYMPVKFQSEIPKDDKKIDFSLGGLFLAHPVYIYIYTGWNKKNPPPRHVGIFFAILNILM